MGNALRDFAAGNPGMQQFVERYEIASADKETRVAYRKWEYEQALNIMERQLQRAEGRAEGKAEVARNLRRLNMPVDAIVEATGMSREEIERLRDGE